MGIAALIAQILPLGIDATEAVIPLIKEAVSKGQTHFTPEQEDAFYAATGKTLDQFDADAPTA